MISIKDFSKVCRLCLGENNIGPFHSEKLELLNKIGVKVDHTDNLPQNVCTTCSSELDSINRFIEKCNASQTTFKGIHDRSNQLRQEFTKCSPYMENKKQPVKLTKCASNISSPTIQCPSCQRVFMRSGIKQHYLKSPQCILSDSMVKTIQLQKVDECKIHTNRRLLKCRRCSKEFQFADNLRTHVLTKHRKQPFKCDVCKKDFSRLRSLREHMNEHTGEAPYMCAHCDKRFNRSAALGAHLHHVHMFEADVPQKKKRIEKRVRLSMQCQRCDKVFASRSGYAYHQLMHDRVRTFLCNICGKKFATNPALRNHIRSHTGEIILECDECGKGFKHRTSFKMHMQDHARTRSFACQHCSEILKGANELEEHVLRHNLVECPRCKKSFLSQNIEKHISSHRTDRPYKCQTCQKCFRAPSHLTVHMRTHSGEKPFTCTYCHKAFVQAQTLKIHMRRHTGEQPSECQLCGRQFYDPSNMNRHLKTVHQTDSVELLEYLGAS